MKKLFVILVAVLFLAMIACSSKGGDSSTPTTYTISGTVTQGTSTSALSGVTVNLSGTATASTTTDTSGNYSFTGQENGSYTVTPSLTGYTFTPTNPTIVVNGANVTNTNFTAATLITPEDGQGGGSTTCNTWGYPDGSYKTIISYSNANASSTNPTDCTHYDGSKESVYGFEYQCVEYVNRFYIEALKYTGFTCGPAPNYTPDNMKGCGNAVQYFGKNSQLGLNQYSNGGTTPPRPDDILVFSGPTSTGPGHVAIVSATLYSASNQLLGISIIQQNWSDNSRDVNRILPICQNPNLDPSLDCSKMTSGSYYFAPNVMMPNSGTYTVLGWLRRPGTLTPQLSVATASGIPGTTFVLSGTGFSANSHVTTHFLSPDGTELSASTSSTDSSGSYSYNVDSSSFVPGIYYAWGVDNTTNAAWGADNIANAVSNSIGFAIVSTQGVNTVVLANSITGSTPQRLCLDSNYIYWTEYNGVDGGNIRKISKSGGSPLTLMSGLSDPTDIAVDSSNIYWSDNGLNGDSLGIINKIPLSINNWNTTVLVNGGSAPPRIVIDSSYVYWAEGSSIKRIPISGGTVETFESGLNQPVDIAIDNTYVYWVENAGVSVKKANKSNKSVTILASGLPCTPGNISIDSSNVYWGDDAYGLNCGIRQISKNGGTITPLVLNTPDGLGNITTDGVYVYYVENANKIMKVAVGGGTPSKVVDGLSYPYDLKIDDTYIYWVEQGTRNRIAKIAK